MNATVKELKENMKSIRETLKRFEEAEKVIAKTRLMMPNRFRKKPLKIL